MVGRALWHFRETGLHLPGHRGGDDLECGSMASPLEGESLAVDHLAGRALEGILSSGRRGRDVGINHLPAEAVGQGGEIVEPVIPVEGKRRHASACRKTERQRRCLGEDVGAPSLQFDSLHLARQAEPQEFVGRVKDVGAPVAEGAVSEVVPGTPLPVHVPFVISVLLRGGEPVGPVERGRDGLFGQIAVDLHAVPAAGLVHEGVDPRDLPDDARLGKCLELEVVRARVTLVAHLGGHLVFPLGLHHQGDLAETLPHRLLAVDMLALRHCQHGDRKVGEIGGADRDGVDPFSQRVEHLAEIPEPRHIGEFAEDAEGVGRPHVRVAEGDEVHEAGLGEFHHDLAAPVADAAAGEVDPAPGGVAGQKTGKEEGGGSRGEGSLEEGPARHRGGCGRHGMFGIHGAGWRKGMMLGSGSVGLGTHFPTGDGV